MYDKILVSLMLISNTIYTFISGIFISLSINILTSLCFDKNEICNKNYIFVAAVLFMLISVFFMFIAYKISRFQEYIIDKHIIEYKEKESIVLDAIEGKRLKWIMLYLTVVILVLLAMITLILNL